MDEEDEFDLATILGRRAGGGRAGHSAEAAASSGLADSEDFLAQLQQDDGGDTQQAAETRLGRLCRQLRRVSCRCLLPAADQRTGIHSCRHAASAAMAEREIRANEAGEGAIEVECQGTGRYGDGFEI